MNVTFDHLGLTFTAAVDYEPYVPARISGPPEDCYPEEGGGATVTELACNGKDASFLLASDIAEDLNDAAYQACVDAIEYRRQEYEESRAADARLDR